MAQDRLTPEDLDLRLNNTICRYKGHPYYVQTGRADGRNSYPKISLYKLDGTMSRPINVDHTSDEFDDSSPPLGYMNYNNQAIYLKRVPHRLQNQGVRQESIMSIPSTRGHWFTSVSMESCILGRYPSQDQAMSTLQDAGSPYGVAIHRHIALSWIDSRTLGLYYKARLIATKIYGSDWSYLEASDSTLIRNIIGKTGVFK